MLEKQSFDQLAASYDEEFTRSPIGRLQRRQVYGFMEKVLGNRKGKKVLELNCGTGVDALWLAQKGCRVKATDLSEGMLQVAQQKIREAGLEKVIEVQQLSIAEIGSLPEEEKYDLIFSNFGGLNCIDPATMKQLCAPIADRLRPGGHFIAVVMPDFCLWESLYFMAKFSFRKVFRRSGSSALSVSLGDGDFVDTWYFSPRQFYRFFSTHFSLQNSFPVGFFIPPSYLTPAFEKRPKALSFLYGLEKKVQHFSFVSRMADHFFIHLVKDR